MSTWIKDTEDKIKEQEQKKQERRKRVNFWIYTTSIVLLVFVVGFTYVSYRELVSSYKNLAVEIDQKRVENKNLEEKINSLGSDKLKLEESNRALNDKITTLVGEYDKLKVDYDKLDEAYKKLDSNHKSIDEKYNTIIDKLEEAKKQ